MMADKPLAREATLAKIATLGGLGTLPAPGTVGSAIALIAGVGILAFGGHGALVFALIITTLLAIPAINAHYRLTQTHDASEVIIDEVIGQWLALLLLPQFGAPSVGADYFWLYAICAFILFRFFDIIKPGPIAAAERLPQAYGVIADDVLAGAASGSVIWIVMVLL